MCIFVFNVDVPIYMHHFILCQDVPDNRADSD